MADSFLADLDELSDEDKFQVCKGFLLLCVNEVTIMLIGCSVNPSTLYFEAIVIGCLQGEAGADAENMEEDIDGDLADLESLNYEDLDSVSKLQKTQRYNDIMQVSSHESFLTDLGTA